jgi:hypothetical protein
MLRLFAAAVLIAATIMLFLSVVSVLFCVFAGLWFAVVLFLAMGAFALVGTRASWKAFRA